MKYCPNCGNEFTNQTNFCTNCGKSIISESNKNPEMTLISKNVLLVFTSAILVIVMSFMSWAKIPIIELFSSKDITINFFSIFDKISEIEILFESFGIQSSILSTFTYALSAFTTLLALSIALLVLSLLCCDSKYFSALAYLGFGLHTVVMGIFSIVIIVLNSAVVKELDGLVDSVITLTPYPYIMLGLSFISMIFFVKKTTGEAKESDASTTKQVKISLPRGVLGEKYECQLVTDANGTHVWVLIDGNLPGGLSLSEAGLISGIPTEEGVYSFTVDVYINRGFNDSDLERRVFLIKIFDL